MKYLSKAYKVPEHWYPRTDIKKAAKIDEYLDYHHTGTRLFSTYVFRSVFEPFMNKTAPEGFNI